MRVALLHLRNGGPGAPEFNRALMVLNDAAHIAVVRRALDGGVKAIVHDRPSSPAFSGIPNIPRLPRNSWRPSCCVWSVKLC